MKTIWGMGRSLPSFEFDLDERALVIIALRNRNKKESMTYSPEPKLAPMLHTFEEIDKALVAMARVAKEERGQ